MGRSSLSCNTLRPTRNIAAEGSGPGMASLSDIEFTAVLVEERLELGTGWLIYDILSERRWKGGHKQSISRAPPTSKLPLNTHERGFRVDWACTD